MLFLFGDGYVGSPPELGPADFGTLVSWIDPRYNLTTDGGIQVTAWTSNDSNAHEATIESSPHYESDGWNGLPCLTFKGNDGIYFSTVATPFAGSDIPYYIVAAVQVFEIVLNDYIFCFTQSSASVANSGLTMMSTNERWCITRNDGATNKFPMAGNFSCDRNPHIMSLMCSGTTGSLYEDGVKIIDEADFDVNSISFNSFNLGYRRSLSSTAHSYVKLGPVLVYSDLDDTGRIQAEQWMRDQGYDTQVEVVTDTFIADGSFQTSTNTPVWIECWGAGGGGTVGVGGGGGGAYAAKWFSSSRLDPLDVAVGTSAADTDGEDTTFDGNVVVAKGGLSGTNGGTGGQASASTGDTKFSGGDAGLGTGNQSGGGGAGDIANASASTGGSYLGGVGVSANVGREISAGGGSSDSNGFSGGRGEARFTYKQFPSSYSYPFVIDRTHVRTGHATSVAVIMPSNIVAGDLLVIIAACDIDRTLTVDGWTKVGQQTDASDACSLALFYKVAAGGDTATLSSGASTRLAAMCYQIRNGREPTWTTDTANSTNADAPNHTFTDGDYLIIAACVWDSSSMVNISGLPENYGNHRLIYPFASTGIILATCDRKVSGTSENPGSWTSTIEQWVSATIAVPFDG